MNKKAVEVCGLCIKNLHKLVKHEAKRLYDVLNNKSARNDLPRLIESIRDFTLSLEELLAWTEEDELRKKFLFYGFGPIRLYGQANFSGRYPVLVTHLNTEWLWQRWKYFLGEVIESGSGAFLDPKEAETLSSMFWPWEDVGDYRGSMTCATGERFVFIKCNECEKFTDIPNYLETRCSRSGGKGLFTTRRICKDGWIFEFGGIVKSDEESTIASLQIDNSKFLESQSDDNFLNHSCEPNCYIDWDTMWLRALRDIERDEELTYDYNTSDWDNLSLERKDPAWFNCSCGEVTCLDKMLGFKHLSESEQRRRFPQAAPYIKKNLGSKI